MDSRLMRFRDRHATGGRIVFCQLFRRQEHLEDALDNSIRLTDGERGALKFGTLALSLIDGLLA